MIATKQSISCMFRRGKLQIYGRTLYLTRSKQVHIIRIESFIFQYKTKVIYNVYAFYEILFSMKMILYFNVFIAWILKTRIGFYSDDQCYMITMLEKNLSVLILL